MVENVQIYGYMVVNSRGAVKWKKYNPSLRFDEVAISTKLILPAALFKKPLIQATITIPPDAASPQEITAIVVEDAKQAISQATGLMVEIKVVHSESDSKKDDEP